VAIQIYFDQTSVNAAKSTLDGIKGGLPRATARALNDTFTGVRTDMVALIRDKYNHKAGAIRSRITIAKASANSLFGLVQSKGRSFNLIDVAGTSPSQLPRDGKYKKPRLGISVNVKKSTGRKIIIGSFLASGKASNKVLVFQRAKIGNTIVGRYPIKAIAAPHPEIIYNTPENWLELQGKAKVRLDKNFAHEVDAIIKGYAK
jgi:hypothetical protein